MRPLSCSFCGKSQYEARRLVQAPKKDDLFICNECIDLCSDIVREADSAGKAEGNEPIQRKDR